jgi:hypothetical protein
LRGFLRTGFEAQLSQTDAVKSLIFWKSPHPLSIVRVKKVGLTWEELLVPSIRQRSKDPPPEELTGWRWACHFCLERYRLLTSWELEFVATVARYTKPPSTKQLIILQRLVARCRNAAA